MSYVRQLLPFLALAIAACSGATTDADSSSGFVDDAGTGTGTGTGAITGLPCEVANLLAKNCTSCHSNPPIGGAPYAISSYEDLIKESPTFPGQTVAQRSVARMQDAKSPMPPSPAGPMSAADIAVLQAWIDGGMTRGDCASTVDAGPSEWSAPVGCLSGSKWTQGDRGSGNMHPGAACVACHTLKRANPFEAPTFLGGTVYSSAHETDDCNAVRADVTGAQVVVTGADGKVTTMNVNSVGNFYTLAKIVTPYTAKVVKGGKERKMTTPQTDGDCNACHTGAGTKDAPGRILLP